MTKKQKLAEMEKRATVLKNQFREILYRSVCMSLFERHKLLFAFFVSLKVYEPDKSFEAALQRLNKKPAKGTEKYEGSKLDQSKMDNSSKISDPKSNSHQKELPRESINQNHSIS